MSAGDDIGQSKKNEGAGGEEDVTDAAPGAEDVPEVNAADGDE